MKTTTTRSIAVVLVCTALLVLPTVSFGATLVKANTTTLVNAADWTNNIAPTAVDTCSYFTGSTISLSNSLNQTLGGNLSISNLVTSQLQPILIKADGYTLTLNSSATAGAANNTCAIDQGGVSTYLTTINSPITLATNATFRVSNGGWLSLKGAIGETGGARSLVLMAATSNGQDGSYWLAGANTYSGGTYIGRLATAATAGSGTLVALSGNATLGVSGSALTMLANVNGTVLDLGGTSQTLGAVNFGSWTTVQNGSISGSSFTGFGLITPNLTGTGLYTLNNSGYRLVLSGANTYIGGTTITAGTLLATKPASLPLSGTISIAASSSAILALRAGGTGEWGASDLTSLLTYGSLTVGANGTLAIDTTGGNFSYSSAIAGPTPANLALTKQGSNTLTLTGANTYQKVTTIDRGTLVVDNTAGGSLSSSSPLTFTGSGMFTYNTASASQSLGALTLTGGEGTVQLTRSGTATLTLSSLTARTAGKTANLAFNGATPSTTDGIKFTTAASGFMNQGMFYNGADYAYMDNANTFVRAPVYGTDVGFTTADTLTPSTHVKLTATPAAQNDITLNTLNLSGSGVGFTLNSAQTLTLAKGGILKAGGGSAGTISAGNVQSKESLRDIVIRTDSSSDTLISSSVLGAAVQPQAANCVNASAVISGLTSTNNMYVGMLVLVQNRNSFGGNIPSTTIKTIDSASQITVNNNFNLTTGSYTVYFGGNSLTKSGAGTLTLASDNNLAGVIFNGGQLNINSTNAIGVGTWPSVTGNQTCPVTLTINEGTTIDNTSGSSITTANYNLQLNGSFSFVGSSDLWFSQLGSATIPNDLTITTSTPGKTLKIGSGVQQTMASLTKRGPGTLQFDANGSQPIHGGLHVYEGVYATSLSYNYWNSLNAGPIFLGDPEGANSRNAVIDCVKVSQQNSMITVNAGSSGTLALLSDMSTSLQSLLKLNNNLTLATPSAQTISYLGLISGTGNLNIGAPSGGLTNITVFGVNKSLHNVGTVRLMNENSFTGNTVINSGTLQIYNALALQNSILDTATSIANKLTLLNLGVTDLTLGGLSGNKNIGVASGDMFATSSSGYTSVTNLTLNPSVGQSPSYSGIIKDGAAGMTFTKTGAGTQTLSGAQAYTGSTTISAGTLALGANDVIPNGSPVIMTGGTLDAVTYTDTLSTLEVTGAATINVGSGVSLAFAGSSAKTWTGTLAITGTVGSTSLRFGESAGGLSADQLLRITINGRKAVLSSQGYLIPFSGMVIQIH